MVIPYFEECGFQRPSQYIRFLLKTFSWQEILSEDVLSGKITLSERDFQLHLYQRKDSLHSFFQDLSPQNPLRIEYLEWFNLTRHSRQGLRIQHMQQTNIQKYGVPVASQSSEVQNKFKTTCLSRYGVDNPQKSDLIRKRTEQTCIQRYGIPTTGSLNSIKKWTQRLGSNYLDWKTILGPEFLAFKISFNHRFSQLGVPGAASDLRQLYSRFPDFNAHINSDKYQKAFEYTSSLEKVLLSHFSLDQVLSSYRFDPNSKQEIDIFFPLQKVGFELNGYYWHSSMSKGSFYHRDKTSLALQNGILLYHLWYDNAGLELEERFQSFINSRLGRFSHSISAGSTRCRSISQSEAQIFHESNHFHGSPVLSSQSCSWGLFHRGDLVSALTFVRRGITAHNVRYTVLSGFQIRWGFQKLLHYAIPHLQSLGVSSIVTYCDRDLTPNPFSSVYHRAGFSLNNLHDYSLQLSYFVKNKVSSFASGHYSRHIFMKHKLPSLGIEVRPDDTEKSALERAEIYQCWNSGTWKYTLHI